MNTLVEFGSVSTATKALFFSGKFLDGAKQGLPAGWYYKTSDFDTTQPFRPAPVG